ncbi:MAG: hypothetical protein OSA22_05130 [Aquiluna sp.]|jgi:uncharacterized membrane protein YvbJ|nr:hypothetical protein [Aquiluna sp.]
MKCKNCQSEISESNFNCPSCGKTTAQSREDLQKIDPQSTRAIAWLLLALGVAGVAFVIVNSATDWYSPLNFIPPAMVLIAGGLALISALRAK